MHWSSRHASRSIVNSLVPAVTDPISGQPELKAAPVAVRRFPTAWYGFAVTAHAGVPPATDYWARMRVAGG